MARITVNTTGTQPVLLVSTELSTTANIANGIFANTANCLSVTCLQDVTLTNSTGIYSWTDFCSGDVNKVSTPADNEVATNIVIDDEVYFGNSSAGTGTAKNLGVAGISETKTQIQWKLVWDNSDANGNVSNSYFTSGVGFVSSLAPTVSPEAPVWVTPMSIAVNGRMFNGVNS